MMHIEKGIPVPAAFSKRNGLSRLLEHMEPGDSVLVPKPQSIESHVVFQNRVSTACMGFRKTKVSRELGRDKWAFVTRWESESNGVRVWRKE